MPPNSMLISPTIGTEQSLSTVDETQAACSMLLAYRAVIICSRLTRQPHLPLRNQKPHTAFFRAVRCYHLLSTLQTNVLAIEGWWKKHRHLDYRSACAIWYGPRNSPFCHRKGKRISREHQRPRCLDHLLCTQKSITSGLRDTVDCPSHIAHNWKSRMKFISQ